MRCALLLAALIGLTGPALANVKTLPFTVVNNTDQTIVAVNLFPIHEGEVIEDNITGFYPEIPPGQRATSDTGLIRCGMIEVYLIFADGTKVNVPFDFCASSTASIRN